MQLFTLWVKTMQTGIKDQALLKIQLHTVCVDCKHPEAALGSSTLLWWCRSSLVSHGDMSHLLTLPFPCLFLRAGSTASAATPRLCLMCKEDGQVSSQVGQDVFSKDRRV